MIYLPHIVRRIILDPIFVPQVTIGGPSEIRGSTRHNAFSGNGLLCCLTALEFLPGTNRRLGHPLPRLSVHCHCCVHLQLCLLLLLPRAQGWTEFHLRRVYYCRCRHHVHQILHIQRFTGASGQQSALRDLLFACCAGKSLLKLKKNYLPEIPSTLNPKNNGHNKPEGKILKSRNPSVKILPPRLHKCPVDQSSVGGQPETEDGWSGPSGAKVVNMQCQNCPISVRFNISYDSELPGTAVCWTA